MPPQCPYAEEVGKLQARVMFLERELEKLQATSMLTANELLVEKTSNKSYWKAVELSVRIVSAVIVAAVFLTAGKFTGAIEYILRIFKL